MVRLALGSFVIVAAGLAGAGCSSAPVSSDSSDIQASAKRTLTIPIVNYARNGAGGRGLSLEVGVAGAPAKPLVIDTGSAGVHILTADIENGARTKLERTGKKVVETYVDGTQLVGEEAIAFVQLGGVDTAEAIHVHLVDEVTCTSDRPGCSGSAGADFFHATGVSGLVGIGMSNANAEPEIFSPLAQLPGELASGYIVKTTGYDGATGTLVVGLTDAVRAEFKTLALVAQPKPLPNGVPAWEDAKVNVCYSLEAKGAQPAIEECGASIVDTGATALFWNTNQLVNEAMDGYGTLASGYTFRARVDGVFDWSFTTSDEPKPGVDMVINAPRSWNTNLGIGAYFAFDVMSDVTNGRLGFKPRK